MTLAFIASYLRDLQAQAGAADKGDRCEDTDVHVSGTAAGRVDVFFGRAAPTKNAA